VAFGFTGKEFDEETGLYYFGARYYDARTSVWVSANPILGAYLDGKTGMGGVYNSFNLGVYSYGHLNPVKFVDPDGNQVDDPPKSSYSYLEGQIHYMGGSGTPVDVSFSKAVDLSHLELQSFPYIKSIQNDLFSGKISGLSGYVSGSTTYDTGLNAYGRITLNMEGQLTANVMDDGKIGFSFEGTITAIPDGFDYNPTWFTDAKEKRGFVKELATLGCLGASCALSPVSRDFKINFLGSQSFKKEGTWRQIQYVGDKYGTTFPVTKK